MMNSQLIGPVEKALARLGLGWGWKERELVLLDLEKLGTRNFPARIRFDSNMLEISTIPEGTLSSKEQEEILSAEESSPSAAFLFTNEQEELALAIRLPVPPERSWRRARILAPLLRSALLSLGQRREELGQAKQLPSASAPSIIKAEDG